MTQAPRPRPVLATIICIYELIVVVLGLMSLGSLAVIHLSRPLQPYPPLFSLEMANSLVGLALALAVAITLWRMRRSAFYILLVRLLLGLSALIFAFLHPAHAASATHAFHSGSFVVARALTSLVAFLLFCLNLAITMYVHDITAPVFSLE